MLVMDLDLLHSSISTKFSSFSRPSCAAAVHTAVSAILNLVVHSEYRVVCRETWQPSVPWRRSAWPFFSAFIFRAVGRLIVVINGLLWAAVWGRLEPVRPLAPIQRSSLVGGQNTIMVMLFFACRPT